MKAVVVRRPGAASEVMGVESIADPTPGRREAVIAAAACGVCFHDVVTRAGTLKAGVEMPIVPGHEIAGEIVAVGADVREFRVGDRVASTHAAIAATVKQPRQIANLAVKISQVVRHFWLSQR